MKQVFKKGDIVASMAGHDEGRIYIVVEYAQTDFVYLADGRYRTLKNKKLKRNKHLKYLSTIDLPDKLKETDIKLAIKNYIKGI
ncbi:MAG: 50S ribosomal protein L14 [Firmicutes bacterium]|nr:50S ribosomal protein L14 [Bacillota bacterium]